MSSRRLGWLGLALVGTMAIGILAAAIPYRGHAGEGYSPVDHYISGLGEVGVSSLAWAFNTGVSLGGMGFGAFVVMLARRLNGRFRTALAASGVAAGIAGALVGVFPMGFVVTHRIVAATFFVAGALVALVFSLWLLAGRRPSFPRWLIIPGATVATLFVVFVTAFCAADSMALRRSDAAPTPWSLQFLEWAALASLLVWIVFVSIALLREPTD